MSTLETLNSQDLLNHTRTLVLEERRATLALIEHLEEIQRRRLFAEMGYSSLWEFCTRELGLSEGSAQRRIQAMRLTRDLPQAKASLESGKLSLSNAAKIQSFRQAEKKMGRAPDPAVLLAKVETLSQRECERVLFELSPEALPRERERIVSSSEERELKLVVSAELFEKLQRIRGHWAHAVPEASYAELLEKMADEVLVRLEKKRGIKQGAPGTVASNAVPAAITPATRANHATFAATFPATVAVQTDQTPTAAAAVKPKITAKFPPATKPAPQSPTPKKNIATSSVTAAAAVNPISASRPLPAGRRVYLPATLRREIWARSGGRCEFEAQNQRCSSQYRLEIDHRKPLAWRGSNDSANLRVLCREHNAYEAKRMGL